MLSNMEAVTINPLPNAVAINNGPICNGADVLLTGNEQTGGSYEWYDSAYTTLLATSSMHTETGLTTGMYTYNYILSVNGCVDTATTVVTVDTIGDAPNVSPGDTSYCEGEFFSLGTTTPADSYTWSGPNGFTSTNQFPPSIEASTLTAGDYSLSIVVNGCSSADSTITISVEAAPEAPTISGPGSICFGDSLILTTSSTCDTFQWIGPGGSSPGTLSNPLLTTTSNRTAIPAGDDAYQGGAWSLICKSSTGCSSPQSNTIDVTINPLPNAVAINNGPICNGADVLLTGNEQTGGSYEWYDSAYTTLLATSSMHTETGLTTGMYTYNYILSVNGCVDTATTVVTVDSVQQAPSVMSTQDTICSGEFFSLSTGTLADSYSWSGPNGFTSTSQYPTAIEASALTAGDYTLSVVVNGCGSADSTITITVNELPVTPVLVATSNVCEGDSVVLTSTASATSYNWISPTGDTTVTTVGRLALASGSDYISGDWSLTTINGNGCESMLSNMEAVTINPLPNAVAINNGPICNGADVLLTGNEQTGGSYEWYDSAYTTLLATSSMHTETGLTTGMYTYNYILSVNGCVDTATTVVTVDSVQQAPSVMSTQDTICSGEFFSLSTGTMADSYSWSGPNGFTSTSQYPTAIEASALTAGDYTLSVVVNGCGSADSTITITVNELPVTPVLVATSNVCEGDSVVLTSTASATSYNWISPTGDTTVTTVGRLALASGSDYISGDWSLTTINGNGCESMLSNMEAVTINPLPNAVAINNGPICNGADVLLTGNEQTGGNYEWYDSAYTTLLATSSMHTETGLITGMYTYNYILSVNGCVDTATTVVTVDSVQQAPSVMSTQDTICSGEFFSLSTGTLADSYSWSGPNGFTSTSQYPTAIEASALTAGDYTLSVVVNGCGSADSTITITVNELPVTPVLVATSNVCEGDSVVLTSTASATSYNWISPTGDTTVTTVGRLALASGSDYISGDWSLTTINGNGCESMLSNMEAVTINPLPNAVAINNGPICNGADVLLTGNEQTGGSYEWYDSAYTTLLATSSMHTETGLTTGMYTYNYILSVNGCVDTATTVVTVDSVQQAPSVMSTQDTICSGEFFSLSTGTMADSYSWSGPNGFTSTSQYPTAIEASALTAGDYTLSVVVNGCGSADSTITITVNELPVTPVLVATSNVCEGDSVVLTSTASATSYNWISPTGDTTVTTVGRLALASGSDYISGDWSLTTINGNGCESMLSNMEAVTINPLPNAVAINNGPICNGADVLLTGNEQTGGSYEWYDSAYTTLLATSSMHTETGLTTGMYTYNYILSVNGCVDTATTVVTVDSVQQAPSVMSTQDTICSGEFFSLSTGTLADSYSWSGPNGFTSTSQYPTAIEASALTAGDYTLSVVVNGCGSADSTITITVNELPVTPVLVATSNVCEGDSVVLTSTASATSYNWISPTGDTTVTTVGRLALASGSDYISGDWSLTTINGNGCESMLSNMEAVTINPLPNAVAINNGPICNGADVLLTGNEQTGGSYEWYDSAYTTLLATSSMHTETGLTTGMYTYNYILSVNGCVDTATTVVTVDSVQQAPSVMSTQDTICSGEFFSLSTGTMADSYSWSGPNGFTSTSQYPTAIEASALTAGDYTLSVVVNGCGSADSTITITVNELPVTPVLVATSNVCEGDSVVLTSTASATSYNWISPTGDTTVTTVGRLALASGSDYISGDWSLTTINSNGCESMLSNMEAVTIYSNPDAIASNDGPACLEGTFNLIGNEQMGASYEWYDSAYTTLIATSQNHTISGLSEGDYTYNYIVNVNGCVDTASTIVTVDSLKLAPVITSTKDTLCEGEFFSLGTVTLADSYVWTGPNGFNSSSQYPLAIEAGNLTEGTYTLFVESNGCGSADTTIDISVNLLPDAPTINGPQAICFGDDLVLSTSSMCDTFQWIGPGGSSPGTLSNPSLTTTSNTTAIPSTDSAYLSGDWSLICISSNGCASPQSSTINVEIVPVPDTAYASNSGAACEGGNIILSTNSIVGAAYSWTGPNGFTSTDQNPVLNNVQLADSGDYQVSIIFKGCISDVSVPTKVVVHPIPDAPLPSSNTPICSGDSLFLYANETADSYSWNGPNGFLSGDQNPFIANADSVNDGFYNLTVTVNGCESPNGQIQVEVIKSGFVPSISADKATVCEKDFIVLNTGGFNGTNVSYVWYGPSGVLDTTNNPTYIDSNATLSDSGQYYLQVFIGSCSSLPSQILIVDVNPNPKAPIVNATTPVCEGGVIQLTTPTIADSYQWVGPNGFNSTDQNPQVIFPVTLNDSGAYSLAIVVDGCSSTDSSVDVVVNPIPSTPLLFSNAPICSGDSLIFYTPDPSPMYEWTYPTSSTLLTTEDTLIVSPATSIDNGIYKLRLLANGCYSDYAQITISVEDSSTALAYGGEDIIVCNGAGTINLDATNNGTGNWSTSSSAVLVTPFDPSTPVTNLKQDSIYELYWTITSGVCGEISFDTVQVIVPSNPIATGNSDTIVEGETSLLDVLVNDTFSLPVTVSIKRSPNNGVAGLSSENVYYENTNGGSSDSFIYEICLQDCPSMCDTAVVSIVIDPLLNVPDIITPDGDGVNDGFVIEGIENYPNHELHIYNRWGNEIYFSDDYKNDWSGIYQNEELPDGTYFYVLINTESGETLLNGYITLHR